jgi:hypothetical protein
MAVCGDAYSPDRDGNDPVWSEAAGLIHELNEALFLEGGFEAVEAKGGWPGVNNPATLQKIEAFRHRRAWKRLSSVFLKALETGNGTIFAVMAILIERGKNPVDRSQAFVGTELQSRIQNKRHVPTVQQMVEMLKANGIATSYTQVKRIFNYFDLTPAPGKRGAPKKAR